MTYTISDVHGYSLTEFKKLLKKSEFSDDDFLYILGDVIDRNGDGGDVTLKALRALGKTNPDTVTDTFEYLHDAPLYEAVTAGDRDFLLVHAGLGNFDKNKKLSQYTVDDF